MCLQQQQQTNKQTIHALNLMHVLPSFVRFAPNFTLSKVVRQLQLATKDAGILTYTLIGTVPRDTLAVCRSHQPRPIWEGQLKQVLIVVSVFAVTCASLAGTFSRSAPRNTQETPKKSAQGNAEQGRKSEGAKPDR